MYSILLKKKKKKEKGETILHFNVCLQVLGVPLEAVSAGSEDYKFEDEKNLAVWS